MMAGIMGLCGRLGAILLLSLCGMGVGVSATLPQQDSQKHLGVASCASSTCHGAVAESKDSNIWRNEYRVWSKHDSHSRAFKVLQNAQSKAIASKLGIGDPTKAKECLDCHADNVSASARGPKFQIGDGVGCEACHGGSEKWIKTHTEPGVSHADNLAKGMYPTEDPAARAELCLSCHLGNENQFATHRIMGAGHPRMSFELDTFTVLQPAHYSVDADYVKRKGETGDARLWAVGQVRAARQIASLLDSHWFKSPSMVPEPSFFDCHACHHPMNDLRWQASELGAGMPPGAIRLNDAPMSMLRVIAERLEPALAQELLASTRALHKASLQSKEAVVAAANGLRNTCDKLEKAINARAFTPADLRAMMTVLFQQSGNGEYRDYTSAEQAVMAIDMMVITLGAGDKVKAEMDKLYGLVEDEHHFSPKDFSAAARSLGPRFKGI